MIEYAFGALLLKTVGPELVLKSINAIGSSAVNICGLFGKIYSHPNSSDVARRIKILDLDKKISILESLAKNIKVETHSEPFCICLISLEESMNDIEKCLLEFNEHLIYNSSLILFSSWRIYNLEDDLKKLVELNTILDIRKELLFNIMRVE